MGRAMQTQLGSFAEEGTLERKIRNNSRARRVLACVMVSRLRRLLDARGELGPANLTRVLYGSPEFTDSVNSCVNPPVLALRVSLSLCGCGCVCVCVK